MARFIHTADWQLGITRKFLDKDAQIRYAQDQFEAIKSIGTLAKKQGVDFVIVCGDVFESNFVESKTIFRALEVIGSIPVNVYILPGNHDPFDSSSIYLRRDFITNKPENLIVFDEESSLELAGGIHLVPAPWTSKRPQCDLLHRACSTIDPQEGVLRIAVAHGVIDKYSVTQEDPNLIQFETIESKIKEGAIHYVALGDRHSSTEITDRVWYSGSPLPTAFDEVNSGKVLIVDLEMDKCHVEEHTISEWNFIQRSFTIEGNEGIDLISDFLKEIQAKDRSILRIGIKGVVSLDEKTRLDDILDMNRQIFASLEIWTEETDIVIQPSDDDLENLCLGGYAKVTLDRLHKMSIEDGPDSERAKDALCHFYRLAKEGGI